MFFAIMIPWGLIMKFDGMAFIWYSRSVGPSKFFKSDPCCQVSLSAIIACCHLLFSSSNDMPNILRPNGLYMAYCLTTFGFSCLQGAHHEAQKSSITYLPL